MVQIEVFLSEGGRSRHHAGRQLGAALVEAKAPAELHLRHIEELAEQDLTGFGGSPTILIEGRELEGYEGRPLWACRRYPSDEVRGWRSRAQLREAVGRLNRVESRE